VLDEQPRVPANVLKPVVRRRRRRRLPRVALLLVILAAAAGIAFLLHRHSTIGAGYALLVALGWRKQSRAVAAIEDRDGVRFYVERSKPIGPTQLVRTPWMRRIEPTDERLSAVP